MARFGRAYPVQSPSRRWILPARPGAYVAAVLADAPIGYWRLDEASGTVAADSSGHGNVGSYTNSPTLGAAGALGGDQDTAATFAQAAPEQYVSTGGTLLPSGGATLEALTNGAFSNADAGLIGQWNGTNGLLLYLNSSPGLVQLYCNGTPIGYTAASLTDGHWHHIVGTHDGTNASLYYDGALVAGPTALAYAVPATAFLLGAYNAAGQGHGLDGSIDEAALYSGALSSTRVSAHWAAAAVAAAAAGYPYTGGGYYPTG